MNRVRQLALVQANRVRDTSASARPGESPSPGLSVGQVLDPALFLAPGAIINVVIPNSGLLSKQLLLVGTTYSSAPSSFPS
jgi:hypothetical protein